MHNIMSVPFHFCFSLSSLFKLIKFNIFIKICVMRIIAILCRRNHNFISYIIIVVAKKRVDCARRQIEMPITQSPILCKSGYNAFLHGARFVNFISQIHRWSSRGVSVALSLYLCMRVLCVCSRQTCSHWPPIHRHTRNTSQMTRYEIGKNHCSYVNVCARYTDRLQCNHTHTHIYNRLSVICPHIGHWVYDLMKYACRYWYCQCLLYEIHIIECTHITFDGRSKMAAMRFFSKWADHKWNANTISGVDDYLTAKWMTQAERNERNYRVPCHNIIGRSTRWRAFTITLWWRSTHRQITLNACFSADTIGICMAHQHIIIIQHCSHHTHIHTQRHACCSRSRIIFWATHSKDIIDNPRTI